MAGRILLNKVRPNTRVSAEAEEALAEYKEDIPLLPVQLHDRVAYRTSISTGQGVTEYETSGKAAQEIRSMVMTLNNIKK